MIEAIAAPLIFVLVIAGVAFAVSCATGKEAASFDDLTDEQLDELLGDMDLDSRIIGIDIGAHCGDYQVEAEVSAQDIIDDIQAMAAELNARKPHRPHRPHAICSICGQYREVYGMSTRIGEWTAICEECDQDD